MTEITKYTVRLECDDNAIAAMRCFFQWDDALGFGFAISHSSGVIDLPFGLTVNFEQLNAPSLQVRRNIREGFGDSVCFPLSLSDKHTVFSVKATEYYRKDRTFGPATLLIEQNGCPLLVISNFQPPSIAEGLPNLWLINASQAMLNQLVPASSVNRIWIESCNKVYSESLAGDIRELITSKQSLYLHKLDVLGRFPRLEHLSILGCGHVLDLSPLARCNKLVSLALLGVRRITDLSPVCCLEQLKQLSLHYNRGVSTNLGWTADLAPLSRLLQLEKLRLAHSDAVSLDFIRSARYLSELVLKDFYNLEDISALLCCPHVKMLNMSLVLDSWDTPRDKVEDYSPLGSLVKLQELNLSGRTNVPHLDILPQSRNISCVRVRGCSRITGLHKLVEYKQLSTLDIRGLKRVASIAELRDLACLKEFLSDFHPGAVAELLAHAAVQRHDVDYINHNANRWLGEAEGFDKNHIPGQAQLATTLGEAFSLLGEHPVVPGYAAFLNRHPDFSTEPCKAWLHGRPVSRGCDVMRLRTERIAIDQLTPGASGVVCSAIHDQSGPFDNRSEAGVAHPHGKRLD